MTSWLEVPTPGGDLAAMREAERELDRRARLVHADSAELARIARDVSSDWLGRTAETFNVRVAAARTAIDSVCGTHHDAARLIGKYCDEWDFAEEASRQAHRNVDDAFDTYARDGKSRAQTLADEVRNAIEGLDDPVEDIPVIGGLASKATGVLTDGLGALAEELIERLLDWNPSTPSPTYRPIVADEVVVDTAESIADSIGSAVEWSIDRLLEGIDEVIDVVGGAIEWAVDALMAVGDALVDAIAAGLRLARDAVNALLDLGAQIARTVGYLVAEAARIVFDALADAYNATIDFLISLGKTIYDAIEILMDVGVTVLSALVILARRNYGGPAEPRAEDSDGLASAAFRRWRFDQNGYRDSVRTRHQLSDLAYGVNGKEIPDGWEVAQEYPGTDGFSATAFRNPETNEVVVAYRGTNPEELGDIRDDALNAAGLPTSQGRQAVELAHEISNDGRFAGSDVSYTGHSLGGSLASTASIATGDPATTFNAAGVGSGNYNRALDAGGHGKSEEQIVNFHTDIDILTEQQDNFDVQPASGAQLTVGSTSDSSADSHSLKYFDFDKIGA